MFLLFYKHTTQHPERAHFSKRTKYPNHSWYWLITPVTEFAGELRPQHGSSSVHRSYSADGQFSHGLRPRDHRVTFILPMWKIGWAPNNVSKWQIGFNSAFKGLISLQTTASDILRHYRSYLSARIRTAHNGNTRGMVRSRPLCRNRVAGAIIPEVLVHLVAVM
jgi:hypothetical protein